VRRGAGQVSVAAPEARPGTQHVVGALATPAQVGSAGDGEEAGEVLAHDRQDLILREAAERRSTPEQGAAACGAGPSPCRSPRLHASVGILAQLTRAPDFR
jgi:hypothetical protein